MTSPVVGPAPGSSTTRAALWQWSIRGVGIGLGLLLVIVVALTAQAAAGVLVMVFVALLLAAAFDPVVDLVRLHSPFTRVQIVIAMYVALVVLATVLVLLLVPAAVDEIGSLATEVPELVDDIRAWADGFEPAIVGTILVRLVDTLESTLMRGGLPSPDASLVVEVGLTAADAVLAVVSIFTMVFFWLISRATLQRYLLALLPLGQRAGVREAWNEVQRRIGHWLLGQLTLMVVVGVAATTAYLVLGLPNALLLGVFAGLAEIVPIVGPAIGAVPAVVSALVLGGPQLALVVVGVYVVIQVVEGNVLVPMVMKNAVGLSPFVVIVALLVGGSVAGIVGALLAVPATVVVAAIVERAQDRSTSVDQETPDIAAGEDEAGPARADAGRPAQPSGASAPGEGTAGGAAGQSGRRPASDRVQAPRAVRRGEQGGTR